MVMTPLWDDNPFTQPLKPIVTWCLIAANIIVFFYEAGAPQAGLDRMIDTFSLTPAALHGDIAPRGALPPRRCAPSCWPPPPQRPGSAVGGEAP